MDSILLQASPSFSLTVSCHFLQCTCTVHHVEYTVCTVWIHSVYFILNSPYQGIENEIHIVSLCCPFPEPQIHRWTGTADTFTPHTSSSLKNEVIEHPGVGHTVILAEEQTLWGSLAGEGRSRGVVLPSRPPRAQGCLCCAR